MDDLARANRVLRSIQATRDDTPILNHIEPGYKMKWGQPRGAGLWEVRNLLTASAFRVDHRICYSAFRFREEPKDAIALAISSRSGNVSYFLHVRG